MAGAAGVRGEVQLCRFCVILVDPGLIKAENADALQAGHGKGKWEWSDSKCLQVTPSVEIMRKS